MTTPTQKRKKPTLVEWCGGAANTLCLGRDVRDFPLEEAEETYWLPVDDTPQDYAFNG